MFFGTSGLYGVYSFNTIGPFCKCPFERGGFKANVSLEMGFERVHRKLMKLGSYNKGNTLMVMNHIFLYGLL